MTKRAALLSRWPSGALLLAVLLLSAGAAEAQKRAVFLPFQGNGGTSIQRALQDAVAGDSRVTVVPAAELERAAQDLGIEQRRMRIDPTMLSKAAVAAQVDAVIKGEVRGRGRRAKLELRVHDGGTGNELRRLSVRLKRGRLAGAELDRTAQRLVPAIEGGQWMGPLPPQMPLTPPGAPRGGSGRDDPIEARGYDHDERPRSRVRDPEPETEPLLPPLERGFEDEPAPDYREPYEDAAPPAYGPAGGRPGISVLGGLVMKARSFDLDGVRLANGEPGEVGYGSGYYPGLYLEADIYPLLLSGETGALGGLGLELSLDYGFLESEIREEVTVSGTTRTVDRREPTSQYQLGAGLKYRLFPFAIGAGEAALSFGAGFTMSHFALEQGTHGYKSNETMGLKGGGAFEMPFFATDVIRLSLHLRGAYLMGSTSLNENTRYPASGSSGFEASGGLAMLYDSQLAVRASYLYQTCSTSFDAINGDPAATSTDTYDGILILIGYTH